ncbi:hypothetical protein AiwAL_14510 [Acidiphilium sp. AL]|nr:MULTISPECIES: hypothetical protein [Acidiphilium]MCU4161299.1 hypothetical protein [Acidiphilium sp. AL]
MNDRPVQAMPHRKSQARSPNRVVSRKNKVLAKPPMQWNEIVHGRFRME